MVKKVKGTARLTMLGIYVSFLNLAGFSQQTLNLGEVSQRLANVYKTYDNMRYMSFDLKIVLRTDTVGGHSEYLQEKGSFTVAGNKFNHVMGGAEYYQGDSLSVGVFRDAKIMVLDKVKNNGVNRLLPGGKGTLDSILMPFAEKYLITASKTSAGDSMIVFTTHDAAMLYKRISVSYKPGLHYLTQTTYEYYAPMNIGERDSGELEEAGQAGQDSTTAGNQLPPAAILDVRHVLTTDYTGYRFDPDSFKSIFRDGRFLRNDGKRYYPAPEFSSYRFYDMLSQKAGTE